MSRICVPDHALPQRILRDSRRSVHGGASKPVACTIVPRHELMCTSGPDEKLDGYGLGGTSETREVQAE